MRAMLEAIEDRMLPWVEAIGARLSRRLPPPPLLARLARVEAEVVAALLDEHRAQLAEVRESHSRERTERLAEVLVSELRVRMENVPGDRPLLGLVGWLDAQLPSDALEFMDEAALDWRRRARIVDVMDRMTRRAGDYLLLSDLVERCLPPAGDRPAVILDIASGPAGFPLAIARTVGRRRRLRIVAGDIDRRYLDLGRQRVERAGLDDQISFMPLDAFRLRDQVTEWFAPLPGGRPDLITCTRSLHHFGPGGSAWLLTQAHAVAGHGILFVDIVRSLSRLMMAAAAGLGSGDWRFAHDAVLSVRKSFSLGELRLIAACTPWHRQLDPYYVPPAYAVLRAGQEPPGDVAAG